MSFVPEGQLSEHLSPEDLRDLEEKGAWSQAILPTSLMGCPVRLRRREGGGYDIKYGKTVAELRRR